VTGCFCVAAMLTPLSCLRRSGFPNRRRRRTAESPGQRRRHARIHASGEIEFGSVAGAVKSAAPVRAISALSCVLLNCGEQPRCVQTPTITRPPVDRTKFVPRVLGLHRRARLGIRNNGVAPGDALEHFLGPRMIQTGLPRHSMICISPGLSEAILVSTGAPRRARARTEAWRRRTGSLSHDSDPASARRGNQQVAPAFVDFGRFTMKVPARGIRKINKASNYSEIRCPNQILRSNL